MTPKELIQNFENNLSLIDSTILIEFGYTENQIIDLMREYAKLMCEKQKEICADNAEADWDYEEHYEDEREVNMFGGITSYVLKQSILKCKNATEI